MTPALSVVMPALDAGPYLDAAVASILDQDFGDFEFVILDDGSRDGTAEALQAWAAKDPRIRLHLGESRRGPAGSSQFVVDQARAPVVARMDADDVARPGRLSRQMEALGADPGAVLVGGLAETVDAHGRSVRGADRGRLLSPSLFAPFPHSSIMFRKAAFDRVGGYRAAANKWEDIDLYLRLAGVGRMLALNAVVVDVRQTGGSSRVRDGQAALEAAMDLMARCLEVYRAGGDYSALLETGEPSPKLRPGAFVPGGASRLWGGRRPGMLSRILARGDIRPDWESVRTLAWALWGDISPATLRTALRFRLAAANRRAERRLDGVSVVEWRPEEARVRPVGARTASPAPRG